MAVCAFAFCVCGLGHVYGCGCGCGCVCARVFRSNELNCDDPNFDVKSAFVIKIVLNHTETSLVYLLRSFKSKTNLSKPLFRFFEAVPLHTLLAAEFSPSSAFLLSTVAVSIVSVVAGCIDSSCCTFASAVLAVDVAVDDVFVAAAAAAAAIVVTLHFLSEFSVQTGLPNVPSVSLAEFLVCQKSSLTGFEQRQQRKRFSSMFSGDSFVIGDTISGF